MLTKNNKQIETQRCRQTYFKKKKSNQTKIVQNKMQDIWHQPSMSLEESLLFVYFIILVLGFPPLFNPIV